jgi:DNA adenine methylase
MASAFNENRSLLRRIGNKRLLVSRLLDLFPQQITTFIDLFFGTGAVTFALLDRVKKVIANDNDREVINLFLTYKDHKEELIEAIQAMPEHEELMNYWKDHHESVPVWQACRFLMLSNFSYLGIGRTMRFDVYGKGSGSMSKGALLKVLQSSIHGQIASPKISYMCKDFREVLPRISFKKEKFGRPAGAKRESFLYADPPYCKTIHNYKNGFTAQDTTDLFDLCIHSGIRFAISEFDSPFIRNLADRHHLYITHVKERRTIKSRNTEILITNYDPVRKQGDLFR